MAISFERLGRNLLTHARHAGWGLLTLAAGCCCHPSHPATATPPVAAAALTPATPPAAPAPAAAPAAPKNDLPPGAAKPAAPFEGEGWQTLFDGRSLEGWRVVPFGGGGEVEVRSGLALLPMGSPFTGISYTNTNQIPTMNYEVALDAMRVTGSDFFCGLTVPVGEAFCSLIVGGWGGSLVGISSLDGMDASENSTTHFVNFESGRWYRLRLRVTEHRLQAWIDEDKLIDVDTTDKRISLRPGDVELSKPLGLVSWQTGAALREVKIRHVDGPSGPVKKAQ